MDVLTQRGLAKIDFTQLLATAHFFLHPGCMMESPTIFGKLQELSISRTENDIKPVDCAQGARFTLSFSLSSSF